MAPIWRVRRREKIETETGKKMQSLFLVERLFPLVLTGEKTSTIRWRETRIVPGPLTLVSEGETTRHVVVTVTRCTDMPLAEAAGFLGKAADWPDDVMLAGMRAHYPEIELSSRVQVVEFDPPVAPSKA